MPAAISYCIKCVMIAYLLPIFAYLTPISTPCTLPTTTIILLVDLVKAIDATISSVRLCSLKSACSGAENRWAYACVYEL